MPFTGKQLILSPTPQLVWSATGKTNLFIQGGGGTQFLGSDNTVTDLTGAPLQPGARLEFLLHAGDELWVIGNVPVGIGVIAIT
jgi:hypothetical protein